MNKEVKLKRIGNEKIKIITRFNDQVDYFLKVDSTGHISVLIFIRRPRMVYRKNGKDSHALLILPMAAASLSGSRRVTKNQ